MKGSISASVVAPPSPGKRPTQKPTKIPPSMKTKAFHCRISRRPWMNASSKRCLLLAELHVLAEFVDDVLRLRQHFLQHPHRLVAGGVLEIELRFLRLGEERRVLDRRGGGIAIHLDDVMRRIGRQ